tara:strand:+ start:142 stop:285 length:144 start_codon:yes stop_codon:yes gene_type:complete
MKLVYTLGELIQFATILLIKLTIMGITYNTFVIKEFVGVVDVLPFVK